MYSINKAKKDKLKKYHIYPIAEGTTLAIIAMLLTSITAYFIYFHAMRIISTEIKEGLLRTVSGIASCLDANEISSFVSQTQKDDENYLNTLKILQKARLATKDCAYIYINRLVDDKVYFIADPTPIDASGTPLFTDEKNLEPSIPMKEYPGASNELRQALKEKKPIVSKQSYTDKWGTFYSAYVPIFDNNGKCVGTLGADLQITEMLARLQPMEDATKRAFFVALVLALLTGTMIWFARRFAKQLNDSRLEIFSEFELTLEFANKSSFVIGKQLKRLANTLKLFVGRFQNAFSKHPENNHELQSEINRLSEFISKIDEVGTLKLNEIVKNETNFSLSELKDDFNKEFKEQKLEITIDSKIPQKIYGDAKIYYSVLKRVYEFFHSTFKNDISLELSLNTEDIHNISIGNEFSVKFDKSNEKLLSLLQKVETEIETEDFFNNLSVLDAFTMADARELIYVMNSGFDISREEDIFCVYFNINFAKYTENNNDCIDSSKETVGNDTKQT